MLSQDRANATPASQMQFTATRPAHQHSQGIKTHGHRGHQEGEEGQHPWQQGPRGLAGELGLALGHLVQAGFCKSKRSGLSGLWGGHEAKALHLQPSPSYMRLPHKGPMSRGLRELLGDQSHPQKVSPTSHLLFFFGTRD